MFLSVLHSLLREAHVVDTVAPLAGSSGRDVPAGRTGVDTGPVGEFIALAS